MVILHMCTLLCINNLIQNKKMQTNTFSNKLNKWKLQEKKLEVEKYKVGLLN